MKNSIAVSSDLIHEVKTRMDGNWKSVLESFLGSQVLVKPNQPCPFCGGKDRFSYLAKKSDGSCFCRHCGYRDGIRMMMDIQHKTFPEVIRELAENLGIPEVEPNKFQLKTPVIPKAFSPERLWNLAKPLTEDDGAVLYLKSRGLDGTNFLSLRFIPKLRYAECTEESTLQESFHQGLLCRVDSADKECMNILRIYLDNGRKAQVKVAKKILGKQLSGGYIKLGEVDPQKGILGLAEGVETALSAAKLFGFPVCSVITAFNFKNFTPPSEVRKLVLFGDSDSNFIGQREVYSAASALARKYPGLEISVRLPEELDSDWNDVLMKSC